MLTQKVRPRPRLNRARAKNAQGEGALTPERLDLIVVWWGFAMFWLVASVGMAAIVSPYVLAALAIVPLLTLAISPLAGLVMYLTVTIWQNLVISFWSPYVPQELFKVLQGINFAVTIELGIFCFLKVLLSKNKISGAFARKAVGMAFALLLLAVLYAGYGVLANGFSSAAIYFRNFTVGLFCLAMGVYFGERLDLRVILRIWTFLGTIVLILAFFELFFTEFYYAIVNMTSFIALKSHSAKISVNELIDNLTTAFFNTKYFRDLEIKSFRLLGSNIHNISFGYLLAFLTFAFAIGKKYILAALSFILILIVGAKGATILTVFSLGLAALFRTGYPKALRNITVVSVCAFLVVFLFLYGLGNKDYHVLGLIGGVYSFLSNPIGHGFGFGGNLARQEATDWQQVQDLGAAPFGLESSVGVLLCQWGIGGVLYLLFILWLWKSLLYMFKNKGALYLSRYDFSSIFLALGFIAVNLVFQEEALSPYAIGFEMLWIGTIANLNKEPARN